MWYLILVPVVLLGSCHSMSTPPKPKAIEIQVEPVYNPCKPPDGYHYPDGPYDPLHHGHAFDYLPTSCV